MHSALAAKVQHHQKLSLDKLEQNGPSVVRYTTTLEISFHDTLHESFRWWWLHLQSPCIQNADESQICHSQDKRDGAGDDGGDLTLLQRICWCDNGVQLGR